MKTSKLILSGEGVCHALSRSQVSKRPRRQKTETEFVTFVSGRVTDEVIRPTKKYAPPKLTPVQRNLLVGVIEGFSACEEGILNEKQVSGVEYYHPQVKRFLNDQMNVMMDGVVAGLLDSFFPRESISQTRTQIGSEGEVFTLPPANLNTSARNFVFQMLSRGKNDYIRVDLHPDDLHLHGVRVANLLIDNDFLPKNFWDL